MPPYEPNRPSRRSNLNPVSEAIRGQSLPLITLGAGALLGLILGLIIGWGIFPVQWTNAWPSDLSDEARAQYLAAVAEAYVYYGDEQAAEIARNRLYNLNDNLPAEIADAQAFFADNPQRNARIYISNLGQLAQGLGVESPDIIVDTPPAAESAPAESAALPDEADVGSSVRSWVNWLLWSVAALALIVGGLFIISRLSKRRSTTTADFVDDEPEGFEEEDDFGTRPGRNPFQRPMPSPMPTSVRGADRTRDRSVSQRESPRGEDYGFDDEHDESPDAFASGAAIDALDVDDELYDDALLDVDDEDLDLLEPESAGTLVMPEPSVTTFEEEDDLDQDAFARSTARGSQDTLLKTFTVHYQAGIPDYDQSYSIMDPASGRYIGECGMGVNLKNGILQNNPDNVIALDVWLVDKKEEKSYSSQSRVLFSEYVIDNKMEQAFTRERPNDAAPLVPQPGMTFQLKGLNLVLDCTVLDAKYAANGPTTGVFQSIKLEMTVRALD